MKSKMLLSISPPHSQSELLERAYQLVGCTFGELADLLGYTIARDAAHSKGAFGQLLERALGATSGSLAQPDFPHLGIELKTLPLSPKGLPLESTYVCTAPIPSPERVWRESRVYKKMAHVLWFPYLKTPALKERKLAHPFLWRMPPDIEHILKQDWEELTEYIHLGAIEKLSAYSGTYLQIRPKAAHSKVLVQMLNTSGDLISIVPKGFYIRSQMTKLILQTYQ